MGNASKWFLCFRPPPTIEIDARVDCSADRVLTLFAAARKSNDLKKKKQKKSPMMNIPTSTSSIPDHHKPPTTSSRRSFSGVVRAVLFETSLNRRVRESKLRNCPDRSVTIPSSDQEPNAAAAASASAAEQTTTGEQLAIVPDRKNGSKGKDEGSDSPPTSDWCYTSVAKETKQSEIGTGAAGRINPVVCLVLISLWVTVFWGRMCAVMTTTVWIYAWQSGAVVVGLGEKLTKNRKRKKKKAGAASEGTEKGIDSFCG